MNMKEFRLDRIKKAAEKAGADMIVATLPANIEYLTSGYRSINQDVLTRAECAVAYIPAKDKTVFIVGYADLPTVFEFSGIDTEVYFSGGGFFFEKGSDDAFVEKIMECRSQAFPTTADAYNEAVRSNLPEGAVIAIDESRIFASVLEQIKAKLTGYSVTNATGIFMEARLIKHPEEIAGVEASARCAADSLMAALAQFEEGMTDHRIGELYSIELAKRGAKPYFGVVTSQLRAAFSDTTNDPVRPIVSGDMIRFDFGCILNGYCSDLGRFAVVGDTVSDKAETYYAAILKGIDAAIEIAKPGVTADELFRTALETVRGNGIPHYRRHHVGHGIGLECYDNPTIGPGNMTPIVENMTFNLETPYYELGWGGMMIEDTFVMTSDGVRMLDHTTRDIIRI